MFTAAESQRKWLWRTSVSLALLFVGLMCLRPGASTSNPLQAQEPKVAAQENKQADFSPYVDATGGISLPDDFEKTFVHVGTVAVEKNAEEPVMELHGTYTRKEDLEALKRDGKFPDGAILVKDVRAVTNNKLTTGAASYGANVKVWFVMIKDSKGRFPDNELWGDGWGWGLFNGDDRKKQVAVNYRTECRSCHVPVRNTDWVYYQCYPELTKALESHKSSARPGDSAPTISPSNKDTSSNVEQKPKPDLAGMFPQWRESQALKGDHLAGANYFRSTKVNNSLTCGSCHSFDPKDSMTQDGDGLIRAGFPVYASANRTNIKNSGTNLAALGGNICVLHFMGGKEPGMSAQELANLDAFLKTGGGKDHPSATNVDYAKAIWTVPKDLTGGDAARGGELAMKTCITCHDVDKQKHRLVKGGLPLRSKSFAESDLAELVLQIRNPDYQHNAEMPGYTDLRLSNDQLLDLIAWFRK